MTGAPTETPPRSRDVLLGALFVAAAIAVVALPRFLDGPIWGDEGFLAFGAERVLAGEIPNRDFVSLQPPFSFYAVATAFAVFGTSLAVLRSVGLALALAVGLATYALALRFARPAASALGVAPLAVCGLALQKFVPFAVWFGVLFCLLSGAMLLAAARRGRPAWAAGAGGLAALALLSRHDQGVYLCLASGLFLGLRLLLHSERPEANRRTARAVPLALAWLGGLGLTSVVPLALWLATGSFPAVLDQLVVFPLTRYAETSAVDWPRIGDDGALFPTLFYYAPAGAVVGLGIALVRARRDRDASRRPELAFLLALTALFYAQVATRSDLFHLVIALPPCFVALALAFDAVRRAWMPRGPDVAAITVIAATSLAIGVIASPHFLAPLAQDARPLAVPRGGVRLSEFEAQQYERLLRYVEEHVDVEAPILALPYQPIFNFVLNRRSPTRWLYLWAGDQTPEDHARLIAEADADRPALVILDRPERLRASAPQVVAWVEAHYAPIASVRSSVYFVPRDGAH